MPRARPVHVVVLLLPLLAACGADEDGVPVSQDLTTLRRGFVAGRVVPVAVAGEAADRSLRAVAPGALDLWVRTPGAGTLRYALPPDVPAASLTLALSVDGTATPLAPAQGADGVWSAPLPAGDGRIAGLALASATQGPIALIAPRIEGRTAPAPPILPPEVRPPGRPADRPPNVVLYVVDTLRADRLSLYGYAKPTSPTLERLARRALVFDRAYAAGSFTAPSVTSLLTSRYPEELRGTLDREGMARTTLAEAFQAAGYATAGFQANLLCTPALGYDRGFDRYQLLGTATGDGVDKASAAQLHAAAVDWVRAHRDRPFFLYLQSMDVHFPYVPPAPFRDRFVKELSADERSVLEHLRTTITEEQLRIFTERLGNMSPGRYDGAVAYADHEIGALFDALETLGVAGNTIVVVTSDHGEPLGDRGEMLHGRSLFEELVRVPLVLWLPGAAGGVRVGEIVSHLDLGPTLLDLAGIPPPASFAGTSWLRPGTAVRPPAAVGELLAPTTFTATAWYAREGPWKVVLDAKGARLFHLPTDPGETKDVSAAHPDLTGYLLTRATARPDVVVHTTPRLQDRLDETQRRQREEALRALGYVE